MHPRLAGLHCRRLTFERVLRAVARAEPGVWLRTGHADGVCAARGRVTGVMAGGRQVDAGLVIDAGGRGGRLTRALRGPAEGGDCGIAYVSRQYQMRPGAAAGPVNMPFGVMVTYPGYVVAVFIHDNRILVRPGRRPHPAPPPDLITAAAQADPYIARAVGPYQAMLALPGSLNAVQARARDIYATGWRPPVPPGPTRDELASLVTAAASSRGHPAQDAALSPSAAPAPDGSPARNGTLSQNTQSNLSSPVRTHLPK